MLEKSRLLAKLQAQIDKLQSQIDDAVDPQVIAKRTIQRDRLLDKKATVGGLNLKLD